MSEIYQKVAYIGLRNPDNSYLLNVPLYIKTKDITKDGLSKRQEEIIHRISEIMIKRYEHQISEHIKQIKGGDNNVHL